MQLHRFATPRGCQSYLVACEASGSAVLIDPEDSLEEQYLARAAQLGLTLHFLLDTHTHADHFSATAELGARLGLPVIMHRASRAACASFPVDDGETVRVGSLALRFLHTPGHTADSMCVCVEDCVFTGDTLLIGACGRTDLPTGDPAQLHDSLFSKLLLLEPATRVFPAHAYGERKESTIGEELAHNPRLADRTLEGFVTLMRSLDLREPDHLTEALRTNLSGGRTLEQLLAGAARRVAFMSAAEAHRRLAVAEPGILVLDVRESDTFGGGHLHGALGIPRGRLEFCVNESLPDPTRRILVCCDDGRLSLLAAATLHTLGYSRAVVLDGGLQAWREGGYPLEASAG